MQFTTNKQNTNNEVNLNNGNIKDTKSSVPIPQEGNRIAPYLQENVKAKVVSIPETTLKNIIKSIEKLNSEISKINSERRIEDNKKMAEYANLLLSKYGSFGEMFRIRMPSQIIKDLQFFSRTYIESDQGKNYVLKNLKLMTTVFNLRNNLVRIDQIFYLIIKHTCQFYYKRIKEKDIIDIAKNVYHLDTGNETDSVKVLKMIFSNSLFQNDIYLLQKISFDNRISLLQIKSQDIRKINKYIIINSLIRGKNYSESCLLKTKDIVDYMMLSMNHINELYSLLHIISSADSNLCKQIQIEIYHKKKYNITELIEKIACHILKTHKNAKDLCEFIFYLSNVYIEFDGDKDRISFLKSQKLKETIIKMLKNIKNIEEEYYSSEFERMFSPDAFDIKDWKNHLQFKNSDEDIVMESNDNTPPFYNGTKWIDTKGVSSSLPSNEGKEKLANKILSDVCKMLENAAMPQKSKNTYSEISKTCVFECDNADMMNDVRVYINELVKSYSNSYIRLQHYVSSNDLKKIHFNIYNIYTNPNIKNAYIHAYKKSNE